MSVRMYRHIASLASAAFLCAAITVNFGACASQTGKALAKEKPVIVVTAFGTSYDAGLANLESYDTVLRRKLPGYGIRWGFTADTVVNKLRKQGKTAIFARNVPLKNLKELYADLVSEGKREAVVQSFHIMVGAEYRQVLETPATGLSVEYVKPLLFEEKDLQRVVKALQPSFGADGRTVTILCAHGNEKEPAFNEELKKVDALVQSLNPDVHVAVMEGEPAFGPVLEKIKAGSCQKVKFIGFMLTYGDHMTNDVMGDEPDSMRNRIGLPAEATSGLASDPNIQAVFIEKLQAVLASK
jgi:sirohydrochlorin cobaltochelatase